MKWIVNFATRLWKDEAGGPAALLLPLMAAGASAAFPVTMAGLMGTALPAAGATLAPAALAAPTSLIPTALGSGASLTATAPLATGLTAAPSLSIGAGLKSAAQIAGAISSVMGMFGPDAPELESPAVMPDPDDKKLQLQRRRDFAKQRGRGRQGTINTDESLSPALG